MYMVAVIIFSRKNSPIYSTLRNNLKLSCYLIFHTAAEFDVKATGINIRPAPQICRSESGSPEPCRNHGLIKLIWKSRGSLLRCTPDRCNRRHPDDKASIGR